jgi:hypothetical protein
LLGTTPFKSAQLRTGEFAYRLVLSNYESVTNMTPLLPKMHMNDFFFLRRVEPSGAGTVPNVRTNFTELIGTASQGVTILTTQGKVEVARMGTVDWIPAQTNMVVSPGDQLRTYTRSGTMMRWSDNSMVRLSELTTIEIAKPSLKLKNGTIYRFNTNGTFNDFRISTPNGTVGVRG